MIYSSPEKNINRKNAFSTKITIFEWEWIACIINLHPYERLKKEISISR